MIEQRIKPIFIFSLPRSGSTLLQRILATSEDISTKSEPWILLPFLYALKEKGVYAEYSHFGVYKALQDLCKEMPNGEEDYLHAVRTAMLQIYDTLSGENEKYFLDKTPRYTLIANELEKTFPDDKFIYLWRNPLSIVASIVETFYDGKWKIFHSKVDLYDGMENLLSTFETHSGRRFAIKYEDLVVDPESSLVRLERYLNLEDSLNLDTFSTVKLKGLMGDPTGIKKYRSISTKSLDGWKSIISNPWRKHWCRRYLEWIGEERLSFMGYELKELLAELDRAPNRWMGVVPDFFYSLYGELYCFFEFKIIKDKIWGKLKNRKMRKHG